MSRTASQMVTNVGIDVQDTSSSFANLILRALNRRYLHILRAINFEVIHSDYTISVTAGTSDYALPTDFKTEVNCIDQTNGTPLDRTDFSYFQREDTSAFTTQGSVSKYIIYTDEVGAQKIKFVPVPSNNITVGLPYIVSASEMATTDTPLLPIEDILETGAIAECWRYKRQGAKAAQMEALYNSMLADFIWSRENQANQVHQFTPTTYSRDLL